MRLRRRPAQLGIALILAIGLLASTMGVLALEWAGAAASVNLSKDSNHLERTDLAIVPGKLAAVWGAETNEGINLATSTNGATWVTALHAPAAGRVAWNPSVAFYGTKAIMAWTEGSDANAGTVTQTVVQKDEGSASSQVIMDLLFGYPAPDLVIAPTGMHMVFAASTHSGGGDWTKGSLYYAHRNLNETAWNAPVAVVTSTEVLPAGAAGGIWYPRLALSVDGLTLNVVWEQKQQTVSGSTQMIWSLSGTWANGHATWSAPVRLSPVSQSYAVRPAISVGPSGIVHVVWTELVPGAGGVTNPDAQYINYRTLAPESPIRISEGAILVNDNFPTWSSSAIATIGTDVCVAWHGFYNAQTSGKEDITLRCSRDHGEHWQPSANVSDSSGLLSIFPSLAVGGEGKAHLVWAEFELEIADLNAYDVYYRNGEICVSALMLPIVTRNYRP